MNQWSRYVRDLTGDEKQGAVGVRVGVDGSTINRWRNGASRKPSPAQAALLALAYGRNPLEAFVAAGWLTEDEAGIVSPPEPDLRRVSKEDLVDEVKRRMRDDGEYRGITVAGH